MSIAYFYISVQTLFFKMGGGATELTANNLCSHWPNVNID